MAYQYGIKGLLILALYCSFFVSAQRYTFVTEDLPPLQIETKDGKASGALVELIELLINESEINGKIQFFPWARSYELALDTPNIFIFSMLRSAEREDNFIWIGKIFTIRSYLASLKSRTDIKIDNIEQAKQYSVGSIRHDLAESYLLKKGFKPGENLYISSKYPVLWSMLYSGRTDMAFTNSIVWQHEITKAGLDASQLKLVYQIPDFASDLYLAANRTIAPEVINKLKKSLALIKADGRYDKLLAKWHLH
ncbi:hypothetical protein tinsulaeT_22000 [Thalassotalea insulae]|uniref:Solute-binding protein family 3/N-terminal domain-containing protein n=1 Tax=Thalassotalea insulae TaxID=2056778 RepID=A0ABQ6GVX9_9GAMM|nr:transporter substrate-binding domain-containing protein [Thalassotalea insulae]GLX78860.1 hypothetical protein tinsulaeT_22000 [Thalassotalea insulae]